jgi:hypothetical protein
VGLCQLKAVAVDSEAAQGESPVVETPVYAAGEIPVAGLRLWLDASQGVEAGTGSVVTSWRERGAYGHTVAQPDIAKRPLLAPAALNGKPVLRFDGVDDSLRGTAFGSTLFKSNAVSILIVQCQAANHPENATLAWNPDDFANQVSLRLAFDGRLLFDYGDPTAGARVSATQPVGWGDNYHLVEAYRDAASRAAIRVDGLELAKRSLAGRLQLDVAGSLAVGGDDYTFLGGEVAEIIVYNRTLTPVEQRLVQLYLVAKYGLAAVSYPSVLEQPRRLPDGRFGLTLAGKPGAEHVVEVSADLLSWVTLTNVAGLAPGVEVVDPDAANHGQRFYRSVMP